MKGKKKSKELAELLEEQEEFIQKICAKFRRLREESGLSQEKFAYAHGFDRTQWGNIENGTDMKLTTLYRALLAVDQSPADFFRDFK